MNKLVILILGLILVIGLLMTGCKSVSPSPMETLERIQAQNPPQNPPQNLARAPEVGNLAPDFSLANLDGETVSLSDLRGSPVLINFWATWCEPCRLEMPLLEQVHEEWSDRGLVLLAIDVGESQAKVENYLLAENLSLPVLMDRNEAVANRYSLRYFPTTYLIDKNGILQSVKIGAFINVAEIEQSLAGIMP